MLVVESTLHDFYLSNPTRYSSYQLKLEIMDLESKRKKILAENEEIWGRNSRVIWVQCGDDNTKYFHYFINHRKHVNSIQNMQNEDGVYGFGFEYLSLTRVRHLSTLFKEDDNASIAQTMKYVSLFPTHVND